MSSRFVRSRLRHPGWWVSIFLIAGPALVLALLGLGTSRADRLEREQQLRDQQVQAAHLADAAIATAIDRLTARLDRVSPPAFDTPGHVPAADFEFPAFLLDTEEAS